MKIGNFKKVLKIGDTVKIVFPNDLSYYTSQPWKRDKMNILEEHAGEISTIEKIGRSDDTTLEKYYGIRKDGPYYRPELRCVKE